MNNTTLTNRQFPISNFSETKRKVLNWLKRFDTFCFLDNHQYELAHHSVECLAAAGTKNFLKADKDTGLRELQAFVEARARWIFGHLSYDLKNKIEGLSSSHPDGVEFPDLFFFEPLVVIHISGSELIIEADDPGTIYTEIDTILPDQTIDHPRPGIQNRIARQEYISIIKKLRQHIHRGDCYEINFCQEFFAESAGIDPLSIFEKLSAISPNPFSALYKVNGHWLICASPERFLKKEGNRIYSQPIKGTAKRNSSAEDDEKNKLELKESQKERSENVMVVDLVRNDLAKVCKRGSVKVDELFGIYSFPQVHQMISTVSGELMEEIKFTDIIKACFPMGSMTGAPKKRVMELIEKYEKTKRGIFSGAVGYISPKGDFDFNVVIRSLMYNETTRYLSFQTGSGITFYSDPEKEWEECLLKAEAITKALT